VGKKPETKTDRRGRDKSSAGAASRPKKKGATAGKASREPGRPFVRKEEPPVRPPKKMSRISRQLSQAGLHLKKGLGQNFLVSQPHLEKIALSLEAGPKSLVLEIGCGLGNLTELIAREAGSILAIELDERFRPVHNEALAPLKNVAVVYGDFMDLDLRSILTKETPDADIRLIGNIPYHLTSPILFKIIASSVDFDCVCLLMQLEVAQRLAAPAGSRDFGILAAKARTRFEIENVFTVPAGAFMPPPKVKSALVRLTPLAGGPLIAPGEDQQAFFNFIDQAFAQRRKVLGKSLNAGSRGAIDREKTEAVLANMGLDANVRAEQLSVEQFISLWRGLGSPVLPSIRKSYQEK
jgi:16S rRNA (adenine1518-N6/adenine1519-N6)-dimethyltransferase